MNSNVAYIRYTWFILVMVFMVIIAGAIVRMTQSGMGCPDWPTCFGRWIPPVDKSQLPPDFEKYLGAQDIDHSFNPYHTWIEYINRLVSALLGVFILIHLAWTIRKFRKTDHTIVYLSILMLVAVGFQAWLGKKVVDANLAVVKVTTHMLVALVIAALPILIISKLRNNKTTTGRFLKSFSVISLLLLLIQIILGTDVREQVDEISKPLGYAHRELWISQLDTIFLVHRSFSWIVAAACIVLWWKARSFPSLKKYTVLFLSLVGLSFATGIIMYYLKIPAAAQPIHVLSASLLAISLFSFRLQLK